MSEEPVPPWPAGRYPEHSSRRDPWLKTLIGLCVALSVTAPALAFIASYFGAAFREAALSGLVVSVAALIVAVWFLIAFIKVDRDEAY